MAKPPAGTSRLARLRERLARSGRVFLLGLVVACGIEVLVDWNSTLFEINVLRGRMRDRGLSYVAILSKASAAPMRAGDGRSLSVLSSGVFDDDDVLAVRFFDLAGHPLHERVADAGDAEFRRRRGASLLAYFDHQMSRDVHGILADPAEQARRMAASRWRDFPQRWNDFVGAIVARFSKPVPPKQGSAPALYQDRLRTEEREREDTVTYAFGTVVDEQTRPLGVVMVVFSMERTNDAITLKYLKGAGMVAFFVALIIVQNLTGRRDKLRLLEIESRSARARGALDGAAPDAPVTPDAAGDASGAEVFATIVRAEGRVDGLLWDAAPCGEDAVLAIAIDPDGEGLDAAGVGLARRGARGARGGGLAHPVGGSRFVAVAARRRRGVRGARLAVRGAAGARRSGRRSRRAPEQRAELGVGRLRRDRAVVGLARRGRGAARRRRREPRRLGRHARARRREPA
jgi:hypothetical protein